MNFKGRPEREHLRGWGREEGLSRLVPGRVFNKQWYEGLIFLTALLLLCCVSAA